MHEQEKRIVDEDHRTSHDVIAPACLKKQNQRFVIHLTPRSLFFALFITITSAFIAGRKVHYFYLAPKYMRAGGDCTDPSIATSYAANQHEQSRECVVVGLDEETADDTIQNFQPEQQGNQSNYDKHFHYDNDNLPFGDLQVDITTNVNMEFLNFDTMHPLIEMIHMIVNETKIGKLLSHECHMIDDVTGSFSCIGVLSESHVVLHVHKKSIETEESDGHALLSLFIHGPKNKLMKAIRVTEEFFREETKQKEGTIIPSIQWTFIPHHQITDSDHIDEIVFPSSPLLTNEPHSTNEAFYEAFVHPALFSHHGPKRVAIVGGVKKSDTNTLKEIIKHKDVISVSMYYKHENDLPLGVDNTSSKDDSHVDDDDEYDLDCSDFVGIAQTRCDDFNKRVVEMKLEDILSLFKKNRNSDQGEGLFDVFMMEM